MMDMPIMPLNFWAIIVHGGTISPFRRNRRSFASAAQPTAASEVMQPILRKSAGPA